MEHVLMEHVMKMKIGTAPIEALLDSDIDNFLWILFGERCDIFWA